MVFSTNYTAHLESCVGKGPLFREVFQYIDETTLRANSERIAHDLRALNDFSILIVDDVLVQRECRLFAAENVLQQVFGQPLATGVRSYGRMIIRVP